MPSISAQSFEIVDALNAIVTLVTQSFGTLVITVQRAGSGANTTIAFVMTQNGVQVAAQVLANPTIAVAEQWVSDKVSAVVGAQMQFKIHFFSVNPTITATIGCFNGNVVVPANWWQ